MFSSWTSTGLKVASWLTASPATSDVRGTPPAYYRHRMFGNDKSIFQVYIFCCVNSSFTDSHVGLIRDVRQTQILTAGCVEVTTRYLVLIKWTTHALQPSLGVISSNYWQLTVKIHNYWPNAFKGWGNIKTIKLRHGYWPTRMDQIYMF